MRSWRRLGLAMAVIAAGSVATAAAEDATKASPPNPVIKPATKAAAKPVVPAKPATGTAVTTADADAKGAAGPSESLVPATAGGGRVIVMRGLANIWSRGMDTLAKKFKDEGVSVTLINHAAWPKVAEELVAEYKADKKKMGPIIIIGHSLGADASLVMANWLGMRGVPVRLIVTFDGVADTHPLIGTVQEVVNYYKPHGWGQEVKAGKGFTGTITNIDLTKRPDIGHLNIDKIETLQEDTLARSLEILKVKPKTPIKTKETAASG